jgi:hypothetical protein
MSGIHEKNEKSKRSPEKIIKEIERITLPFFEGSQLK